MKPSLTPTLSFYAVQKAAATLRPFVRYHFPVYGLEDRDFVTHLDLLVCVEAAIYQADEEAEAQVTDAHAPPPDFQPVIQLLQARDLVDAAIEAELADGHRYYALEKRMCRGEPFSYKELIDAITCKSFDVRILHRLTQQLAAGRYDEELLALFAVDDRLVEIQHDLLQYADDVARNVFNVYRMFLKLFGADGAARLAEYIASLNAESQSRTVQLPASIRRRLQQSARAYRQAHPFPPIPQPIAADWE